jgi:two-component system, OmpR family, phosphate regulon response regulator PhoB
VRYFHFQSVHGPPTQWAARFQLLVGDKRINRQDQFEEGWLDLQEHNILLPSQCGNWRAKMKVILVEDDLSQANALIEGLKHSFTEVLHLSEPRLLFQRLMDFKANAIVLDWYLPELDGLQTLKRVRSKIGAAVPIIMLSANHSEDCIVEALQAGADEFVPKPTSVALLSARINALVRRASNSEWLNELSLGDFKLLNSSQEMLVAGKRVSLTPREFDLAWVLVSNAGRFVSRSELMASVWGKGVNIDSHTVTQHVYSLKQKAKFSQNGYLLHAVYGAGYRLEKITH